MRKTTATLVLLTAMLQIACQFSGQSEKVFRAALCPPTWRPNGLLPAANDPPGASLWADSCCGTDLRLTAILPARNVPAVRCDPVTDCRVRASVCLRENRLDSARYYCRRSLAAAHEPVPDRCRTVLLLCAVETFAGDEVRAGHYRREYDSLFRAAVARERELSALSAAKQSRKYAWLGWGLLAWLACTGLFFILAVFRFRRIIRVLRARYSSARARSRLQARCPGVESADEPELLKALDSRMLGLQKLLDTAYDPVRSRGFHDEFKSYLRGITSKDFAFADLRFLINRTNFGLVDFLRRHHPRLTDYEMDLICMFRFGFSFNGIRLIYNHDSIYSLYSRRTKLHRKMGLSPNQRLEEYLEAAVVGLRTEALRKMAGGPGEPF